MLLHNTDSEEHCGFASVKRQGFAQSGLGLGKVAREPICLSQ
jgi:hypothetical protein